MEGAAEKRSVARDEQGSAKGERSRPCGSAGNGGQEIIGGGEPCALRDSRTSRVRLRQAASMTSKDRGCAFRCNSCPRRAGRKTGVSTAPRHQYRHRSDSHPSTRAPPATKLAVPARNL